MEYTAPSIWSKIILMFGSGEGYGNVISFNFLKSTTIRYFCILALSPSFVTTQKDFDSCIIPFFTRFFTSFSRNCFRLCGILYDLALTGWSCWNLIRCSVMEIPSNLSPSILNGHRNRPLTVPQRKLLKSLHGAQGRNLEKDLPNSQCWGKRHDPRLKMFQIKSASIYN